VLVDGAAREVEMVTVDEALEMSGWETYISQDEATSSPRLRGFAICTKK
jgi:hypothetical protein